MIVLGIACLILGLLVAGLHVLFTLGIVLIIIGIVLALVRPGGRHWY